MNEVKDVANSKASSVANSPVGPVPTNPAVNTAACPPEGAVAMGAAGGGRLATARRWAAQCSLLALAACGGGQQIDIYPPLPPAPPPAPAVLAPTPAATPAPAAPSTSCSGAGVAAAAASTAPRAVCMLTTQGELVLELYPDKAPKTVENFLKYVNAKFYDGTLFHRIIPGFVVQGGGYDQNTAGPEKAGTFAPIPLESNNGLSNFKLTLAMARTNVPDSATSQFFINLEDNVAGGKKADGSATINNDYNPAMSGKSGYAVFGKVISGGATVTALAAVPLIATSDGVPQNRTLIYWAQQVK